jgi:hypothetical protein
VGSITNQFNKENSLLFSSMLKEIRMMEMEMEMEIKRLTLSLSTA